MTIPEAEIAPPAMPGYESMRHRPQGRPVDLVHLSRQTMGDRELERDVLRMFVGQAAAVRDRIAQLSTEERIFLVHGLKGSARSVGAFPIAECAGEVESRPSDTVVLGRLAVLIDEVEEFVAAISR